MRKTPMNTSDILSWQITGAAQQTLQVNLQAVAPAGLTGF
ncbi:hypothetical protein BN434_2124 [Erwinia amylovora CFBP 2585]|nr:hypothetical protein BN434_2124 [Erwinia amylovora CFBP 2585]